MQEETIGSNCIMPLFVTFSEVKTLGGLRMIDVNGLTLTYPNGKGVFDLTFTVPQGAVTGYLGPNGAGKTTTIRALLGFMQPNRGSCTIGGLNCVKQAPEIQKKLGYIPGEIAFLDGMNGDEFLQFMHQMRGLKNNTVQKQLLERFELDPKGRVRKFSKGMKQKLGIVAAFMHEPEVLILDEPTSGLDPLMQSRFIELLLEEKAKGKTILMSSHIFEETERVCDDVLIIKAGKIIVQSDMEKLKSAQRRGFVLQVDHPSQTLEHLHAAGFEALENLHMIEVYVTGEQVDRFIKTIALEPVRNLDVRTQSLEDIFMQYYSKEEVQR